MWELKMDNQGEGPSYMVHGFQGYHEEQLPVLHQEVQEHYSKLGGEGGEGLIIFPPSSASSCSPILPWPLPPIHHHIDPAQFSASNQIRDQDSFFGSLPPPPPPAPPIYADLYSRRASTALQFAYDGGGVGPSSDPLGFAGLYMTSEGLLRGGGVSSSSPFAGLHAEFGRMTAQEIMDAKALAASKSHSEAERRRRERINAHFAKLRSLLPSTTKTDKASLLAEVIQHVKELKRQTSELAEESPLPTESDELTVDAANDEDGRFLVRASLCCEDRSDLLPDLIRTLKALHLRTLKAEITTLGGRVKNVLVITGEEDPDCPQHHQQQQQQQQHQSIASIQDALKAVMERTAAEEPASTGGTKRQRTNNLSSILERRSI